MFAGGIEASTGLARTEFFQNENIRAEEKEFFASR
jgi:hypothetical protein